MDTPTTHKTTQKPRRKPPQNHRKPPSSSWCCSFKTPPKSPETKPLGAPQKTHFPKPLNSHPGSPKPGFSYVGRIDPRKILSPGRVSPIDNDFVPPKMMNNNADVEERETLNGDVEEREKDGGGVDGDDVEERENNGGFDVRLSLKSKNGGVLVLELNSRILRENSLVFDGLIRVSNKSNGIYRIEVPDVENLGVFRETIELMFEDDVVKKLVKLGVFCAINILEVSAIIKFNKGISACLKYLEAVPWTEEEEEKLRRLFTRFKFDDETNNEIFSRINLNDSSCSQQNLASQIVRSITTCGNAKARNVLKLMVKGLLSRSSVYEKDRFDITKEDLYSICQSCISSLVTLFEDMTDAVSLEQGTSKKSLEKPLIESVAWQVENINWLLEILLDRHIAEDFVDIWAHQKDLLEMHQKASPMVRYELSRVSAALFVAMGTRRLQCQAESRFGLLHSWFSPMLLDFGWLQRCRKGLNVRELEEGLGQALLTLPLKQQYGLFMEWFRFFSKHGTECPNLSKAFQIWWRRSFLRGSETHAIESR